MAVIRSDKIEEKVKQNIKEMIKLVLDMNGAELKKELKSLIDQQQNLVLLQSMKSILLKEKQESEYWKDNDMIKNALKSEEDIKAGRLFTIEEVEEELNRSLDL